MRSIYKDEEIIRLGQKKIPLDEKRYTKFKKIKRFELSSRTNLNLRILSNIYNIEWYDFFRLMLKRHDKPNYIIYGFLPQLNPYCSITYFRRIPESQLGYTSINFLNGKVIPASFAIGKELKISGVNINSTFTWIGLVSVQQLKKEFKLELKNDMIKLKY